VDAWVAAHAARIAERAPEQLAALVALSTPSGDAAAAEAAVQALRTMLPPGAVLERPACSTPGSAPDLVARVYGDGSRRILLVGHLDTVVAHAEHRPLAVDGDRLTGSGTVDMKGGDVLAAGVLRALAGGGDGAPAVAEAALLMVNDEEWRTVPFAHGPAFAHFDACLTFEAGQLTPDGGDAVVVRRKAAGTLRVRAHGRSAHSGSAPHKGANALLALAAAAQAVAAQSTQGPPTPETLTAVPTVLRAGDAFNVVPAAGELMCDLRAPDLDAIERAVAGLPAQSGGVALEAELLRRWPGMDARAAAGPLLERAGTLLGRPVAGAARGGASDASHFAAAGIALTVDGLGPRGGGAHAPHEHVLASSLRPRAEVALAVAAAALSGR